MHQQSAFLAIGKAKTLLSRAEISVKESSELIAAHECADCLEEHNRSWDPPALPQLKDIRCWQRSGGKNAKVPCLCFATFHSACGTPACTCSMLRQSTC